MSKACVSVCKLTVLSFQEVFKEVRILDSNLEKHDMETPAKPKRLPITQKFYAFYHAPIVKFWFNTVSFLLSNVYFIWRSNADFGVLFPTWSSVT